MDTEIYIILEGHGFFNEAQTMVQVFFPNAKYIACANVSNEGISVKSAVYENECAALIFEGGVLVCEYFQHLEGGINKNAVKTSIYNALSKYTSYFPKWGILTGIRPAKLARAMILEGRAEKEVYDVFLKDYLVSYEKAALALSVAKNGIEIRRNIKEENENYHLYAGIPFCPSRCLYCSFTSEPIAKYDPYEYLNCLKNEIEGLPDVKLSSVYIGGGTPTSLDEKQLETLLLMLAGKTGNIEYTVEAGRPDTITKEKLEIMSAYGVNRLSINPQTMNEQTLIRIGRGHSPFDIQTAFKWARAAGFNNINMDLILGLPGETPKEVANTFERVSELQPDSITVHTLSVKRASVLHENLNAYQMATREEIEEMLKISSEYAEKMEMIPYSMYRNKNTLGNFENVGYCKKGKHSIFNMETLDETGTIFAVGAGAITKIVEGDKISRIFNAKSVDEYMRRMTEAKSSVFGKTED